MAVMIGVDPHKRSHTAVAIDRDDVELAAIEVRASARQVVELLGWAAGFAERTWAVEGAGGVGYLLAQQLVASGEPVLDVPATLAARVRVLGSGRSNKTDANDGYSIAVAARHAPKLQQVASADHASVLRLLAKRNKELGSARTRTVCRLHALLVELVPGGTTKEITANRAAALLTDVTPANPVEATRHELALEHLADLRRVDEQMARELTADLPGWECIDGRFRGGLFRTRATNVTQLTVFFNFERDAVVAITAESPGDVITSVRVGDSWFPDDACQEGD